MLILSKSIISRMFMSITLFYVISVIILFLFNHSDLYVKGYLVVGDRKVSKKKTHICKFSKEPNFNEVFMYSTSVTGLALQVSIILNVETH